MTIRAATIGKVDLVDALCGVVTWLPKVVAVLMVVFVPPFAVFLLALNPFAIGLVVILIGILTVMINLGTSVLLPYVVSSESGLAESIKEGVRLSWGNKRFLWMPLACGLLLSGAFVFLSVDFTATDEKKTVFGEYAEYETKTRKLVSRSSAHFVWVPSFDIENEWHKELFKTIGATSPPTIAFRVSLLMLIASLIINLELVRRVWGRSKIDPAGLEFAGQPLPPAWIAPILLLIALPVEHLLNLSPAAHLLKTDPIAELKEAHLYTNTEGLRKELFFDEGADGEIETGTDKTLDFFYDDRNGEYFISGQKQAVVLDKERQLKRRITFSLGTQSDGHSAYFTEVAAVDTDGNGTIEFLGVGGYPNTAFLLDEKGRVVWKRTGDGLSVRKVDARDLNKDGVKELLVADDKKVEVFDLKGNPKFDRRLTGGTFEELFFLDIDGDAKVEALNVSFRNQYLVGLSEETEGRQLKKPYSMVGVLEETTGSSMLFFQGDQLGLFFFDGSLQAKLSAPLSEIADTRILKPQEELFQGPNYSSVFRAKAARVKFRADEPAFLAVAAHLSTKRNMSTFMCMLYIYNGLGELVYQESFPGTPESLRAIAGEHGERLFLVEDGRTWTFRTE